jgi:predicted ATPase
MKIKKIHIRNFRSIQDETIFLNDINLLVGKNDSGKSNLLKAMNLFFNGQTGWNEDFLFDRDYCSFATKVAKKAEEISITLTFEGDKTEPVWRKRWRADSAGKTSFETMWDKKTPKKDRQVGTGFKKYSRIPSAVRKVTYIYIPALKSPQFISELIGTLNKVLSQNAKAQLKNAAGKFETALDEYFSGITDELRDVLGLDNALHMPLDLHPIFQALEFLDQNNHSLSQHGDGIRAQHIPILLNHILKLTHELKPDKEIYSSFVWGYEEPENNIEIGQAYKFAKTFVAHANEQQILLTTHSPAFYSLPESLSEQDDGSASSCLEDILIEKIKWKQGNHSINRYFINMSSEGATAFNDGHVEALDKDFMLPITSRFQLRINELLEERRLLLEQIENMAEKAVLFVEGITDKTIMEIAWSKLNPTTQIPFAIVPCDNHDRVRQALNTESTYVVKPELFHIGIFDFDSAYNQWDGLGKPWKNVVTDASCGLLKKRNEVKGFGMLLPVPEFRTHQASSTLKQSSVLSVELLFSDDVLGNNVRSARSVYNPDGLLKEFIGDKVAFSRRAETFDKAAFSGFEKIFDALQSIINGNFEEPESVL